MNQQSLNDYKKIDWEYLLRKDLGASGDLVTAKPIFDRIKLILDKFVNSVVLQTMPQNIQQEVSANVTAFFNFTQNNISSYTDSSQRSTLIDQINTQENTLINNLSKYIYYLNIVAPQEFGNIDNNIKKIESEVLKTAEGFKTEIAKKSEDVKKATTVVEYLINNKDEFDRALAIANEWINTNKEAVELFLQKSSTTFANKANKHITFEFYSVPLPFVNRWKWWPTWITKKQPAWKGTFMWLVLSFVFGIVSISIVGYFILTLNIQKTDLGIGASLLRITSLLIPIYFSLFASQQYLNHRKLHEAYAFKDVALQTMMNLYKQFTNNSSERSDVLKQALNVIFNEPTMKDSIKYDKQFLSEILKMLKNR